MRLSEVRQALSGDGGCLPGVKSWRVQSLWIYGARHQQAGEEPKLISFALDGRGRLC